MSAGHDADRQSVDAFEVEAVSLAVVSCDRSAPALINSCIPAAGEKSHAAACLRADPRVRKPFSCEKRGTP
jgi:hypothetical protein